MQKKKKEFPFFTTGDNTIRGVCEKISSFRLAWRNAVFTRNFRGSSAKRG